MKIQFLGGSTFLIKSGKTTLLLDPTSDKNIKLKSMACDIAVMSDPRYTDADKVKPASKEKGIYLIQSQGEYEIGGIYVELMAYNGRAVKKDSDFVVKIRAEEVNIVYLGYMNTPITQKEIENLGTVNILIAPIGYKEFISHEAVDKVIAVCDPQIFIPSLYKEAGMHSNIKELVDLDDFLKHLGTKDTDRESVLKVKASNFKNEEEVPMRVVVLEKK